MKKIKNPWNAMPGYQCFGCAQNNEHGLKMEFYVDGDEIVSIWNPEAYYQGWIDTLHGGIQCTLIDEIAGWTSHYFMKACGVTSKIETKFIKPIYTNKGELTIRARMEKRLRNIAIINVTIRNKDGEICTEGMVTFFTFSKEISEKQYFYTELETEEE